MCVMNESMIRKMKIVKTHFDMNAILLIILTEVLATMFVDIIEK